MDEHEAELKPLPGQAAGLWVREHRTLILFALLLLVLLPLRGYWSPDEPDFAQCVKEMRLRGEWLLPYLNGLPYSEKPILFYWFMKVCALGGEALTGGLGFVQGVAPWALRLPSVITAIAFMAAFQRWAERFLQKDVARIAMMILATTPLWVWQSQYIQIDLFFCALLAWAWLQWLGGYLLLRGLKEPRREGEAGRRFLAAYAFLALAFLAKGPLAPVLSLLLVLAFLAWQRDWKTFREMRLGWGILLFLLIAAPWSVMMAVKAGPHYVYELVVKQNLQRATHAFDHIQPWYQYLVYMLSDFFPWVLLLPALGFFIFKGEARRSPVARFLLLAFVVPLLFLSWVQSKQGKYLLMAYPMLALLMAGMLQPVSVEGVSAARIRRLGSVMALGLGLLAVPLLLLALGLGGHKVQAQLAGYHGLVGTLAILCLLGTLSVANRAWVGEGQFLVRETASTLGLVFLVGGAWGFHRLDAQKDYKAWTAAAAPLMRGRQVYFWDEIRSGAMIYTDQFMPEIRKPEELARLGPEDRLVVIRSRWEAGHLGLRAEDMAAFEPVLEQPQGGDVWMLMRKAR
ncbi:MAG TPA: glycosyltransferase family 39 protein [Holophagaceae bacterium]|nr:glycosyltransferase family 39 protein [Holophagaceae bacterium]